MFDEPLSNLDAELRVQMRLEIAQLQRKLNATMIFVTHDQVEAMTLAHKIVVMRDGRIEQEGTPREVYNRPANLFVARFVGSPAMNLFDVVAVENGGDSSRLTLGGGHVIKVPFRLPAMPAKVGLRPEHVRIHGDGETGMFAFDETDFGVIGTEHLGDRSYGYYKTPLGDLVALQPADQEPGTSGSMVLSFDLTRYAGFRLLLKVGVSPVVAMIGCSGRRSETAASPPMSMAEQKGTTSAV